MKLRVEYLFVVCSVIAVACSQEEYVRDYPQITSSAITLNTAAGVTVQATMGGVNRDKVSDVGFVWGEKDALSIEKSPVLYLGKPESDNFSAEIKSKLVKDKTYFMRAFLKTDKNVIYGEPMSFKSLGSEGAVIQSVSPTLIVQGDVVTIAGERFGTDTTAIKVYIVHGSTADQMKIKSLTDTQIIAIAPKSIFETGRIAIIIKGDNATVLSDVVTGKAPKATGVTSADLCSPIQVNGVNLLLPGKPIAVWVNNDMVSPMPTFTETSFNLPASYHTYNNSKLTIEVAYGPYYFTTTFNDPAPKPTVAAVPSSYSSSKFVVTGTSFPACGGLTAVASDAQVGLLVSNVTSTQFTINVNNPNCVAFNFYVVYYDVPVVPSTKMDAPAVSTVTSVSPLSGKPGDQIIITGTNLDNAFVSLSAGGAGTTLEATINSTQIQATIFAPPDYDVSIVPDGNITLSVIGCGSFDAYPFHIDLPDITFTDVTPQTADTSTEIVLTGTNFLSDPYLQVSVLDATIPGQVNQLYVPIIEKTDTSLRLQPVSFGASFDRSAYITIISYGRYLTFPTTITITP